MKNSQKIDTSLIIPAYNESSIIEDTLIKLNDYVAEHTKALGNTEIIVLATGTDNTGEIAQNLSSKIKNLIVIDTGHKRGKGLAVRLGFKKASRRSRPR